MTCPQALCRPSFSGACLALFLITILLLTRHPPLLPPPKHHPSPLPLQVRAAEERADGLSLELQYTQGEASRLAQELALLRDQAERQARCEWVDGGGGVGGAGGPGARALVRRLCRVQLGARLGTGAAYTSGHLR
jgi:hypothetical protein